MWFEVFGKRGRDALTYTGDMGTFVFARLEDMFEFFRADWINDRKDGKDSGNKPEATGARSWRRWIFVEGSPATRRCSHQTGWKVEHIEDYIKEMD